MAELDNDIFIINKKEVKDRSKKNQVSSASKLRIEINSLLSLNSVLIIPNFLYLKKNIKRVIFSE